MSLPRYLLGTVLLAILVTIPSNPYGLQGFVAAAFVLWLRNTIERSEK